MKAPVRSSGSLSLDRSVKAEQSSALFALLEEHEHEQVSLVYEPSSGYRGIIAIHDTTLGPALGGTRFWNYANDRDALIDCLRLARGKTVAIQGCGHVGYYLADLLYKEGAQLIATDIDAAKLKSVVVDFRATAVGADEIYGVEANIFAPCALGGIINDQTIPQLKVEIVAGGANNQLAEERHGDMLEQRGITYAPDYVINAGGLVNVNAELEGWTMERARNKAGEIYETILMVFDIAAEEGIPSYRAADRLAERRIAAIAKVRQNFV